MDESIKPILIFQYGPPCAENVIYNDVTSAWDVDSSSLIHNILNRYPRSAVYFDDDPNNLLPNYAVFQDFCFTNVGNWEGKDCEKEKSLNRARRRNPIRTMIILYKEVERMYKFSAYRTFKDFQQSKSGKSLKPVASTSSFNRHVLFGETEGEC